MVKKAQVKRIWMGVPSWPNHAQICADLGLELKTFNHATPEGTADIEALRAAVAEAEEGDAFLLHGCCHNPTGIDYTNAHWDEIAGLLELAFMGHVNPELAEDALLLERKHGGVRVGAAVDMVGPHQALEAKLSGFLP